MNEKWKKIITGCLITLTIETIAAIVILFPFYKVQRIFDSIDQGKWTKTQEYYNALGDTKKEQVQGYLNAYAAFICDEYINGDMDYIHAAAALDAINSIEETGEVYTNYMPMLEKNEYKATIKALYEASVTYNKEVELDSKTKLNNMGKRLDNTERDQALVELLNEKYEAYIKGECSSEQLVGFNAVVAEWANGNASSYVGVINENMTYVDKYRKKYDELETKFDDEKFFYVMEAYEKTIIPDYDTEYLTKYEDIYRKSYDIGLQYYRDKLQGYLDEKKKDTALELMDKIRAHYGEDFDLQFATDALMDEWQVAAVAFAKNIGDTLQNDLQNSETGRYILDNKYDELKPDRIALYDIDHDGNQEIILYNSSQAGNKYVTSFIYAFDGDKYNYVGNVNVIHFSDENYIVAFPDAFGRETGDECQLIEFDGRSFSVIKVCKDMNGTYTVDGETVDNVAFLSAQGEILKYENVDTADNIKYSSIDEAESFVATFE